MVYTSRHYGRNLKDPNITNQGVETFFISYLLSTVLIKNSFRLAFNGRCDDHFKNEGDVKERLLQD